MRYKKAIIAFVLMFGLLVFIQQIAFAYENNDFKLEGTYSNSKESFDWISFNNDGPNTFRLYYMFEGSQKEDRGTFEKTSDRKYILISPYLGNVEVTCYKKFPNTIGFTMTSGEAKTDFIQTNTIPSQIESPSSDSVYQKPSNQEIAAARSVVEEYFRACEDKDSQAILKTLTPDYNKPNTVLFGEETKTLLAIDFRPEDPMRQWYITSGRGSIYDIREENVIVFRVSFNIEYPEGVIGVWNEGKYEDWSIILIRDDKDSSWLIDDQGY